MNARPLRSRLRTARLFAAAAGLLIAASRLPGDSFSWSTHGPFGGSMSAVAMRPSDGASGIVYAGTFLGRAFRSDDGGINWTPTSSFGTTFVTALAVDPVDPLTVYVASGNGTFKSTDGGEHWTFSLASGPLVAVDPANRDRVYASVRVSGPSDQLHRSDDGGASWSEITGILDDSGTLGVFALVFDPDGTVFVATNNGVFRSADAGATWLPSSDGLTSLYVATLTLDPANSAVLYAGTATAGAFKSEDHGATWTPKNQGFPSANVLALLATQGVVVASLGFAVYQTGDGGETWTPTGPLPDPTLAKAFAAGSDSILMATSRGLYRSDDVGFSWQRYQNGLSGNPAYSLALSPTTATILAGTGTGPFRSFDQGLHWHGELTDGFGVNPNNGAGSVAVDPTDDAILYASATACCGVYKTIDGGTTWNPTGLQGNFFNDLTIDTQSPTTVYAIHPFDGVFKTTDGGDEWDLMSPGIPAGSLYTALGLDPNLPATLYVATQPADVAREAVAQVYRSPDGAESWAPTEGLEGRFIYDFAAAPSDSAIVYAAADSGVFVSLDSGLHWSATAEGIPDTAVYSVAVDPFDPARVYAGTLGEGVYRSFDGGASWYPLHAGGSELTVYTLKTDPGGSVLYAGTPTGVFDYRFSFVDVPASDPFHGAIQAIALNGVTSGCGFGNYCPNDPLSRAQSAVFLLRSLHGGGFQPPAATGLVFADVPADAFAAAWIEELAAEGITSGCGGGNFCPDAALTRAAAAVFLLRAKHGAEYAPPPATGTVFADVSADAFAAAWIEQLALEGITSGCGGGNFCPDEATTRAQAAALLVRTFAFP